MLYIFAALLKHFVHFWVVEMFTTAGDRRSARSAKLSGAARAARSELEKLTKTNPAAAAIAGKTRRVCLGAKGFMIVIKAFNRTLPYSVSIAIASDMEPDYGAKKANGKITLISSHDRQFKTAS